MRIAFVGKGGSGKTTLAARFARWCGDQGMPTVAMDADINQHLLHAAGIPETRQRQTIPLADHAHAIKTFLRGTNPRIAAVDDMIKTTPLEPDPNC